MCAKQTGKIYYSMGEVTEMFDVNPSLIRFWESKFDILKPHKNKKGNRLFTPADIDNLKLIYHLVKEKGMTLTGARNLIKANREGINRDLEVIDRLLGIKALLAEIRQELNVGADFEADPEEDYTTAPGVSGILNNLTEGPETANSGNFAFTSDEIDRVAGTKDYPEEKYDTDGMEGYTAVGAGDEAPEPLDGLPSAATGTVDEYPADVIYADRYPDPADEMETVFADDDNGVLESFGDTVEPTPADISGVLPNNEYRTVSQMQTEPFSASGDRTQPEAGPENHIFADQEEFTETLPVLPAETHTGEAVPLVDSPGRETVSRPSENPAVAQNSAVAGTTGPTVPGSLTEQVQQIVADHITEIAGEELPQEYIGELSDEIAEEAATAAEVMEALAELEGSRDKKGPEVYEQTLFDF